MPEPKAKLVVLPDPYRLTWRQWSDTVVGYNPGLRDMNDSDSDWIEFARRLCEALPDAPRPMGHDTWQDWAASLKGVFHL